MYYFVIVLIVFMVFLFVTEPFFARRKFPNRFISKRQARIKDLLTQKEYLVRSLSDLELDNATRKVDGKDFQRLRKSYITRLDTVSRELGGLENANNSGDIKKLIEQDVLIRRKVQKEISPRANGFVCASCSTENLPGSNFCSSCGKKISVEEVG